ncbi:hypothetical protein CSKR_112838 [Clonorchis sinensis]|uniref:Uncharacterized protein n=1 Tax=Clonorchis sinensis TaxID=79923 RepID=A0A3R7F8N0_CLOSI|nr:hypothetical protein CSKR_112838 [Clonorchis sinensis]
MFFCLGKLHEYDMDYEECCINVAKTDPCDLECYRPPTDYFRPLYQDKSMTRTIVEHESQHFITVTRFLLQRQILLSILVIFFTYAKKQIFIELIFWNLRYDHSKSDAQTCRVKRLHYFTRAQQSELSNKYTELWTAPTRTPLATDFNGGRDLRKLAGSSFVKCALPVILTKDETAVQSFSAFHTRLVSAAVQDLR